MKEWVTVCKLDSKIKAQLIEDKLNQDNIPSVCINKMDSSYNNFGAILVQVPHNHLDKANQIIGQLTQI